MKGQWGDIQITNINFKAKIQDFNVWKRGWGDWGGFEARSKFLFLFLFFLTAAKRWDYVWVCVSALFPRIEPVGKPYREVCLQTKLWPWKVHQPSSWSKRPGTWINDVLAFCRVGRKYVGCIELLFKVHRAICRFSTDSNFLFCLTATLTFSVRNWKFTE